MQPPTKFTSSLKPAAGLLLFSLLALAPGCSAPTPSSQPTASPSPQAQVLPAFKGLPENPPTKLTMKYSWGGLTMSTPDDTYSLERLSAQKQYAVTGERREVFHSGAPTQTEKVTATIAESSMVSVLRLLSSTVWKSAKEPAQVITHTDDYPSYELSFTLSQNLQVKLFSTSNSGNASPWNLKLGNELYTSDDESLATALMAFFDALSKAGKPS